MQAHRIEFPLLDDRNLLILTTTNQNEPKPAGGGGLLIAYGHLASGGAVLREWPRRSQGRGIPVVSGYEFQPTEVPDR